MVATEAALSTGRTITHSCNQGLMAWLVLYGQYITPGLLHPTDFAGTLSPFRTILWRIASSHLPTSLAGRLMRLLSGQ